MNSKTISHYPRVALGAALLLCTAVGASAAGNSIVTFSVDMTGPIQSSAFTPGTSHVFARGMFNNWSTGAYYDGTGTSQLTNNPLAANPNIYSGTFADTNDANGSTMQYKYYIDTGGNWESVNNRQWGLPSNSGGTLVLPTYYFNDTVPSGQTQVTNVIEFQVDMTQQIALGSFHPGTDLVFARGSFNDWGNDNTTTSPFPLTNNPAAANTNLYTGIYMGPTGVEGGYIANYGSVQFYKYWYGTNSTDSSGVYESIPSQDTDSSGNRVVNLLFVNGTLILPKVYFSDQAPIPPVTNVMTFQVDMSVQIALGKFNPPPNGADYVEARGSFNNWSSGFQLTNNPPPYTNKYSGVWTNVNAPSFAVQYKFWSSTFGVGYETPASTGGGNRSVTMLSSNGSLTVPDVFFNDQTLNNTLPTNTVVNFSVDMTGAVQSPSGTPFDPNSDSVYVNGDFLGWWTWRGTPDDLGPAQYQLTNNPTGPNPNLYSISLEVPVANSLALTYKYSIGGADNEAPSGQNHLRYIRTVGNYTFAQDKFANQYNEPNWGQLSIGQPSGGNVLVSWLGLPNVNLQTKPNLGSGAWTNLPATSGVTWSSGFSGTNGFVSTTNYPTSAGQTYLRLIQPAAPSPAP